MSKNKIFSCFFLFSFFILASSQQQNEIEIIYDISDPDLVLSPNHDIKNFITSIGSIRFPQSKPSKNGFVFSGWSSDFIYGYLPNGVFYIDKNTTSPLVFYPVFVENNDKNFYFLSYYVEVDGKFLDTSKELPPEKHRKNEIIEMSLMSYPSDSASQIGWKWKDYAFIHQQKIVMPNHDIEFTPIWHYYHSIIYKTGDVEGIIGNTEETFTMREGGKKELPESSRFSRIGYKIIGWHCSYDEKDYKLLQTYTMPDADVEFYAIWEPITYTILFKVGKETKANSELVDIKIIAKTDTIIEIPEVGGEREGYIFKGWLFTSFEKEEFVYLPGDDFLVPGFPPGLGISLDAIWEKKEE